MWPDRVSNLGPLTYESGALPTALRGPATTSEKKDNFSEFQFKKKNNNKKTVVIHASLWLRRLLRFLYRGSFVGKFAS